MHTLSGSARTEMSESWERGLFPLPQGQGRGAQPAGTPGLLPAPGHDRRVKWGRPLVLQSGHWRALSPHDSDCWAPRVPASTGGQGACTWEASGHGRTHGVQQDLLL